MAFQNKTVYHSALVKEGQILVRVTTGKMLSSKQKDPNKAGHFWVAFEWDGNEYQYAAESEQCADDLGAWRGYDVTIRASGREASDAIIEIIGADGTPLPPPTPAPRQQAPAPRAQAPAGGQRSPAPPRGPSQATQRPAQAPQQPRQPAQAPQTQAPAAPPREPQQAVHGQLVGMAINQANTILLASKAPPEYFFTPAYSKDLATLSSDIIRISLMLQNGKLVPAIKERLATPPPAANQRPPAAPAPEPEPPQEEPQEEPPIEADPSDPTAGMTAVQKAAWLAAQDDIPF